MCLQPLPGAIFDDGPMRCTTPNRSISTRVDVRICRPHAVQQSGQQVSSFHVSPCRMTALSESCTHARLWKQHSWTNQKKTGLDVCSELGSPKENQVLTLSAPCPMKTLSRAPLCGSHHQDWDRQHPGLQDSNHRAQYHLQPYSPDPQRRTK